MSYRCWLIINRFRNKKEKIQVVCWDIHLNITEEQGPSHWTDDGMAHCTDPIHGEGGQLFGHLCTPVVSALLTMSSVPVAIRFVIWKLSLENSLGNACWYPYYINNHAVPRKNKCNWWSQTHGVSHGQKKYTAHVHMCTLTNYTIFKLHMLGSGIPCDHCSVLTNAFNKWEWGHVGVHPHPLFPGLIASALNNCGPGPCVRTEQWSTPWLYWELLQG